MRSVPVLSALLLVTCPLAAQQPTPPDSAQRRAQQATEMVGPMMQQMAPMMQQMAVLTMEGTLVALAKPENAEHLADFTKHYYDALLKRGFTKEQALQIVIAAGIPHPASPGR